MIAPPGRVIEAAQQMLTGFEGVEGAFVYGSVARGTARPGSDIDLFVVTVAPLGPEVRARLHSAAARLQHALGYEPDPIHVVEAFPTGYCADVLTGPLVLRATHMAADGRAIDRITLDSDDLEILRALQDRRLVVRPSPVIDGLTALASRQVTAAALRLDVPIRQVLTGIGLKPHHATPVPVLAPEDLP